VILDRRSLVILCEGEVEGRRKRERKSVVDRSNVLGLEGRELGRNGAGWAGK
jgi:hypothetical protein